jgi:hypothetical protein
MASNGKAAWKHRAIANSEMPVFKPLACALSIGNGLSDCKAKSDRLTEIYENGKKIQHETLEPDAIPFWLFGRVCDA